MARRGRCPMLKSRKYWLPIMVSLQVAACSDASMSGDGDQAFENAGATESPLVLSEQPTCRVELTKVNYDQPGSDTNDFIELQVTATGGLVSHLSDCGLQTIVLFDSALCLPYGVVAVANLD